LYAISIPAFLVLTLILTLVAVEAGYWLGRWRLKREHELDATAGAIVGTTLGLLAFTLAFTFAMAAARFDTRKQFVVDEANAVGTTYLHALMLPAPQSSEVRRMLREYTDARLELGRNPGEASPALARSEELHAEL
jgi:hypothetical protein